MITFWDIMSLGLLIQNTNEKLNTKIKLSSIVKFDHLSTRPNKNNTHAHLLLFSSALLYAWIFHISVQRFSNIYGFLTTTVKTQKLPICYNTYRWSRGVKERCAKGLPHHHHPFSSQLATHRNVAVSWAKRKMAKQLCLRGLNSQSGLSQTGR